nr:PH domain-containing protein [Gordonia araii]
MMAVRPIQQLPQLVPVIIAIAFAGRAAPLIAFFLSAVALGLISVVPWLTTRYQVTGEHVRLRTGLVNKKVATARRDRIRSVDLTASAPHRILGLKKVVIGTGTDDGNVELDCVGAPYGEALQAYLMPTGPSAYPTPAGVATPAEPATVLARFRPDWLRYAPFSLGGLAAAAAGVGFAAQFAGEAGLFDRARSTGSAAVDWISRIPVPLVVLGVLAVVCAAGALLSLTSYLLGYWNFTLARYPDATLRVSRGLITTTSTSLDENRVRGVHLHEPVLMRLVRGARLFAIATGSSKHPLLLPPAPRVDAVGVAGAVADASAELALPLDEHGPAARRRRWFRAAVTALVIVAIVATAWFLGRLPAPVAVLIGIVGAVPALLAAPVRYRHLGTRVTDRLVIVSSPTLARHRFVVERDGIVGWSRSSSIFQRRQGIATLILATAAGTEAYAMVDLRDGDAAGVMVQATPELVRPFLVAADD